MAKAMKILEALLEGIAEVSSAVQSVNGTANNSECDAPTYGDAVQAITNSNIDGYWKARIIEHVPKGRTSAEYKAVISICEDQSTDAYWKERGIEKVFDD